jgi:hypothetical protein
LDGIERASAFGSEAVGQRLRNLHPLLHANTTTYAQNFGNKCNLIGGFDLNAELASIERNQGPRTGRQEPASAEHELCSKLNHLPIFTTGQDYNKRSLRTVGCGHRMCAHLFAFLSTSFRLAPVRVYDSYSRDFVRHAAVFTRISSGNSPSSKNPGILSGIHVLANVSIKIFNFARKFIG